MEKSFNLNPEITITGADLLRSPFTTLHKYFEQIHLEKNYFFLIFSMLLFANLILFFGYNWIKIASAQPYNSLLANK